MEEPQGLGRRIETDLPRVTRQAVGSNEWEDEYEELVESLPGIPIPVEEKNVAWLVRTRRNGTV